MLPQVEAFLQSSSKVKSFQIIDNDPLDEANYLLKIRCELISGNALQIRLVPFPATSDTLIRNSQTSPCDAGITPPIFLISRTFLTINTTHKATSWSHR
jgi:hypothetical protein